MKNLRTRAALIAAGAVAVGALSFPVLAAAVNTSETSTTTSSPSNDAAVDHCHEKRRDPKLDLLSDESLAPLDEQIRMSRDLYHAIEDQYEDAPGFEHKGKDDPDRGEGGPDKGEEGPGKDERGEDDREGRLTPGIYANEDVQNRYDELLKRAQSSLDEAYKVAIEVEEYNIKAIDQALASTRVAEAKEALQHIRDHAEGHLDRFTRAANGEAVTNEGPRNGRGERAKECEDAPTEQQSS